MTSPVMLPGFWDQNGAALTQLAQTITRVVNPYYDSQLALMDGIRKNPEAMSSVVDMAYLNPDLFAQQFGPRMLQRFSAARPSADAQIENNKSAIMGADPASLAPTVLNEVTAGKLGVKTGTERAQGEANLASTRQQTSYYTLKQAQEELQMPELQARSNTARANLTANPNAAQYAPDAMAEEYYNRRRGGGQIDPSFLSRLDAMFIAVPESKALFDASLEILSTKDLMAEQVEYQKEQEVRRNTRDDNILDRQIRDDARKLVVDLEGKVNFQEAYDYLKGNPSDAVGLILRGNLAAETAQKRSQIFRQINDDFRSFSAIRNRNSPEAISARTTLEASLGDFLGTAVTIETSTPAISFLGDPKAKFRLQNGQVIDGSMIGRMVNDQVYADYVKSTDEELVAKLARLDELLAGAMVDGRMVKLSEQAYNTAKKAITDEQTRRQTAGRNSNPSGGRRPN